jgi:hypothetical protein
LNRPHNPPQPRGGSLFIYKTCGRKSLHIFTYKTWPISRPSNMSTSHTAPGRRIGRLNRPDRACSGFLAKKSLIFPKIILQSKDRARGRAQAKLLKLRHGTRATPVRHSRCRIWSHGLQSEKRRGRKRKRRQQRIDRGAQKGEE